MSLICKDNFIRFVNVILKDGKVDEWTISEKQVVKAAIEDMMSMLDDVFDLHNNPDSDRNQAFSFDTLFEKYFPIEDKADVLKVLEGFRARTDGSSHPMDETKFYTHDTYKRCNGRHYGGDTAIGYAYVVNSWLSEFNVDTTKPPRMFFCTNGNWDNIDSNIDFFTNPAMEDKRCPITSPTGND